MAPSPSNFEAIVRTQGPWRWWSVDELADCQAAQCFEPSSDAERIGLGRGSAWRINVGGQDAVLRHYRRGGLPARFSASSFLYFGFARTRPWREWQLSCRLWQLGLPVAKPLAAGFTRRAWRYQAALLTARLPDAESLGEKLRHNQEVDWSSLAKTVANFHNTGLDHVDLNVDNLLISRGRWYMIDFDRCQFRRQNRRWQAANCARLKRSLHRKGVFSQSGWSEFERAYSASISAV